MVERRVAESTSTVPGISFDLALLAMARERLDAIGEHPFVSSSRSI
jgi:hypothetical protein